MTAIELYTSGGAEDRIPPKWVSLAPHLLYLTGIGGHTTETNKKSSKGANQGYLSDENPSYA